MATDGTNIIDGDLAIELYSDFMQQYDQHGDIDALLQQYEEHKVEYRFDDFSYEIYVTTLALALWEIGAITPYVLKDTEQVIELNACAKSWAKEVGEDAGREREKVLALFLKKISKPHPKPKKRKKLKKPKIAQLFRQHDLVTFQYPDQSKGISIIAEIGDEYANFVISYSLIVVDYQYKGSFSLDDFRQKAIIYLSNIPTGQDDGSVEPLPSAFYREVFDQGDGKFLSQLQKIGSARLSVQLGQSHLANTYADFCDPAPIQSSIRYEKSLKQEVSICLISDFVDRMEVED